jgi:hypothetical protein
VQELVVEIVRGGDDHRLPGWVEVEFVDVKPLSERSMTHKGKE